MDYRLNTALFFIGLFLISAPCASTPVEDCKKLFDNADYEKALAPCLEAGKSGHADSQSILGEIYDNQGNSRETYYWWIRAANAGYLPARNQLAMKYYYGGSVFGPEEGWRQDYPRAYSIWKKDAVNGNAPAQFMVAEMHFRGQGVTQDYAEAWAWFRLALDGGYKLATDVMHEMKQKMTSQQLAEGKQRYRNYKQRIALRR